jgi:tRNA threonylcarbamoyladenosine biosynthesis protein TsaE
MPSRDLHSLADTTRFAHDLARELRPGDVVALEGEMGAGKTTFVRSLVEALGGSSRAVSSPTYVLLNVYPVAGGMSVYHLDAYRVGGADDFEAIGFDELLQQGGIVVVEWPSRVASLIPASALRVRFERVSEDERRVTWSR